MAARAPLTLPDLDLRAMDSTVAMVRGSIIAGSPDLRHPGRLERLERVGRGRSGQVFRAWDPQLQREVALKLCPWDGAFAKETHSGVLQEARLLARIRHSNVVTVYGLDQHEGWLGVCMEFIRGKTLEALLYEQGRLAAREAALIGLDLCSALVAVHSLGLLHRDIKATNVMREDGGRIVLMDFGLSQDLHDRSTDNFEQEICGTPLYMAPELLRGEKASAQTDIFGLGVLLYHLVSGGFPVEGRSLSEMRHAYERGETILLRDRRGDLPEAFSRAVERALSPEPGKRFATAGRMAQALSASLTFRMPRARRG